MLRYEILILSVPEITGDEAKQIESRLEKAIEKHKGTVISFERWGKFRLAYPIQDNDYGVYFLIRFEIENNPSELLDEIKTIFNLKLDDIVMRHMVTKLDPEASLAYHRPQSLEDTPARDVDSFLRENKMEGLLSLDKKKKAEKEGQKEPAKESEKTEGSTTEKSAEAPAEA